MYVQLELHADEGELVGFIFQESKPERRGIKEDSTRSVAREGTEQDPRGSVAKLGMVQGFMGSQDCTQIEREQ